MAFFPAHLDPFHSANDGDGDDGDDDDYHYYCLTISYTKSNSRRNSTLFETSSGSVFSMEQGFYMSWMIYRFVSDLKFSSEFGTPLGFTFKVFSMYFEVGKVPSVLSLVASL